MDASFTSDFDKELAAYDPELLKKPQVIAANKIDSIYGDENEIIKALKDEFEKDGIKVFPISAVSGQGLKELIPCEPAFGNMWQRTCHLRAGIRSGIAFLPG